jgi:hypothetical protein
MTSISGAWKYFAEIYAVRLCDADEMVLVANQCLDGNFRDGVVVYSANFKINTILFIG